MERKRLLPGTEIQSSTKCRKLEPADSSVKSMNLGLFSGCKIYVLSAGLGKARTGIFRKQLAKHGAEVQEKFDENTSHFIVDEAMTSQRFIKITNLSEEDFTSGGAIVVKAIWLSTCLSEDKLINTSDYELFIQVAKPESLSEVEVKVELDKVKQSKEKQIAMSSDSKQEVQSNIATFRSGYDSDDSSYVPSDEDETSKPPDEAGTSSSSNLSTPSTSPVKLPRGNWVCSKPSTTQGINQNEHITEKLEILMTAYKNTKDQWRALSYRKAIGALKRHPKAVTSWEEANNILGVGSKLADKVWEIIQSGHLRKIDHICQGEEMKALDIFNNIWGVGPTVAQEFVQMGYRTLNDIQTKAKLNKQQQIGLRLYDDFLDRMSREEATLIGKAVEDMAHVIDPRFVCTICGSYRRGKKTCGDVDVLISHPDGQSHKGILFKLLEKLRRSGFLTDDLIRVEERGEQKKYMGVCKLTGDDQRHRRLDIIIAPYNEYPCALLHFTGSDHFNRSIRALAKKKDMSLSEHALRTGVIRRGQEKIHEGTPMLVTSEKDIFVHMGLEYRTPLERDY